MARIAPSLLYLVASALLALVLSIGSAGADIRGSLAGGSVAGCPAPQARDCARGL
ncbi:hypothetical protein HKCCSP123_04905 [Rhodobacterales bacterium HKCCSP123]|nr:hypothetical protein [Rhodobacterales bacterium HKCCSP123]